MLLSPLEKKAKRRQMRIDLMQKRYGHLTGKTVGNWKVHKLIFTTQSYFECTCIKCGRKTNILAGQVGKKRYCECTPQEGRWDIKGSIHTTKNYTLDENKSSVWTFTAPEAIIMFNNMNIINKFKSNPYDDELFVIHFRDKHILILPFEILLPYRLVKKFLKEREQILNWLQPYLKFRESGMIDINPLGDKIFDEDIKRWMKK